MAYFAHFCGMKKKHLTQYQKQPLCLPKISWGSVENEPNFSGDSLISLQGWHPPLAGAKENHRLKKTSVGVYDVSSKEVG